jgi:hypothetical protein
MFRSAAAFNQDIGNWDVSKGTSFSLMFEKTAAFNQDIGNWDVSKGTSFSRMFWDAAAFNQDIGNWDVSKGIDFSYMFTSAAAFNQDIGNWKLNKARYLGKMLSNSGLSKTNYDNTLIGWAANPNLASGNITIGADNLRYCAGAAARTSIINTKGWTFDGDTEECPEANDLIETTETRDQTSKIANTTTTKSLSEELELDIYPNPTNYALNIEIKNAVTNSRLTIRDQLGRVVWEQKLETNQAKFLLSVEQEQFPVGMYWVGLDNGKTIKTKKLIIIR